MCEYIENRSKGCEREIYRIISNLRWEQEYIFCMPEWDDYILSGDITFWFNMRRNVFGVSETTN
jgi:hypothetical protein